MKFGGHKVISILIVEATIIFIGGGFNDSGIEPVILFLLSSNDPIFFRGVSVLYPLFHVIQIYFLLFIGSTADTWLTFKSRDFFYSVTYS